jgi:E3 ubiquitin-protein ligase synoviolin
VQRPNFYSAAVYLSQSSANLMILTNLLFVIASSFLLGLQKLLYGDLRPIEIEQLYEKAWFAVTETCLAMTVFRGEIGLTFLAMFFSLLTGKVWGWIGEGRVEVLEQQPPRNPRLFHTRLALSLGLSVAFDLTMLEYVVKQVMKMARPDMMVMFGFEFAVLSITNISTAMRYAIDLVEIGIVREQKRHRIEEIKKERVQAAVTEFQASQTAPAADSGAPDSTQALAPTPTTRTLEQVSREAMDQPVDENEVEVEGWEDKGRYMFYLNLATDFFKLVIYLAFFFILLVFYGLPIHILRDVFLTMRSFMKRISDFLKYRTATRDMNARYPDATADDIGPEDVCIICREEMRPYQPAAAEPGQAQPRPNPVAERMRPKRLPCGHVLHFSCLRSWLERQQICPTCRANVVRPDGPQGANTGAGVVAAQGNGAQHPPAARQGPRVYQFGPLRIGVGAARGNNMFEDLQQQLGDADAPPGGGQRQNADPNAPQQFGVGLRWSRRRQNDNSTTQQQLDALTARLSQEVRDLSQNSQELRVLRSMQAELQRLRSMRLGESQPSGAATVQNPMPATGLPPPPGFAQRSTTLVGADQQNILQAGSDRLPAGLTLPEGWTMMPLHPTQQVTYQHSQHVQGQPHLQPPVPPFTGVPIFPHPVPPFNFNIGPQPANVPHPPQASDEGQGHSGQPHPNGTGAHAQPQAPAASNAMEQNGSPDPVAAHGSSLHEQIMAQHRLMERLATSGNQTGQAVPMPPSVPTRANATSSPLTAGSVVEADRGRQQALETDPAQLASSLGNSLPVWGSATTGSPSSERINHAGDGESSEPFANGHHEDGTERAHESSGSSQTRKGQPTVEDLVEDPD